MRACIHVHYEMGMLSWQYGDTFSVSVAGDQFLLLASSDLF